MDGKIPPNMFIQLSLSGGRRLKFASLENLDVFDLYMSAHRSGVK
jgi:hypothetical protein